MDFRITSHPSTRADDGAAGGAERRGEGTNDLLVSDVVRTNELRMWFVAEARRRYADGANRLTRIEQEESQSYRC